MGDGFLDQRGGVQRGDRWRLVWRLALETGVWLLLVFLAPISVPIVTFQSVSLNWHGGEASGMAEMGMVAGGQHSGDRCGDRCGD